MTEERRSEMVAVNAHVLVVDDEPLIVAEIMEFLARKGIDATAADSAAEAFRKLKAAPEGAITVILSDVRMPGRDGLAFARDLYARTTEATAVEVVIMTGHATMSIAVEALRAHVFDFFPKPVKFGDLEAAVHRAHAAAMTRRKKDAETREALEQLQVAASSVAEYVGKNSPLAQQADDVAALAKRASEVAQRLPSSGERTGAAVLRVINDELRNPLVPLVGLGELIEENAGDIPPAQLAEYGGLIRQAGKRLTDVIGTMLRVASLQAGDAPGPLRTVAVEGILAELRRRHDDEARERGQSITATCPPGLSISTDRELLLIGLNEIVANALRHGSAGQSVSIVATAAGDEVSFQVADSGPGMDAAEQAELRKPFHTGDMSLTKASGSGIGLGLTLAEEVARSLGGRLELGGRPGGGTLAAIVLPVPAVH